MPLSRLSLYLSFLFICDWTPTGIKGSPLQRVDVVNSIVRSSKSNALIAYENYAPYMLEYWVALSLGDELPTMRNELIRRKNNGEGFIPRHFYAFMNITNWQVDPDNDKKEEEDPFSIVPYRGERTVSGSMAFLYFGVLMLFLPIIV